MLACEVVVKQFLPALRAELSRELQKKGFNQTEIADVLGITQAAVSKYLSGNYGKDIKKVGKREEIRNTVKEIAEEIAENKEINLMAEVCSACKEFRNEGLVCELHWNSGVEKECSLCKR